MRHTGDGWTYSGRSESGAWDPVDGKTNERQLWEAFQNVCQFETTCFE